MKMFLRTILLFLALGMITSCEKYLDVNTNPNLPVEPPLNGLLSRTTQNTAMNVFRVGNITSYYVQYLASPNAASATDVYEPIDASSTWTALYDNMADIYDLEQKAIAEEAPQYQGVAKILMAINLSMVHNLWGAAPYSTAFSGETLTPTYDDAPAVFQKSLALLDEGITLLGQAGGKRVLPSTSPRTDMIHNGSAAAWIRTAHALKARLLNQLSETNQYNTQAIFTELAAAYTSSAQDAFITTFEVRNPWNQVALNNSNLVLDGWLSEQYVDAMDGTTFGIMDPRLRLITDTTRFGDYRGTPNGRGRGTSSGTRREESYLSLNGYYSSTASPLYIISYDELKFIEAEAALRSGDRQRAYTAYLAAIRANMDKLGVAATARDAYINSPQVSVGAANLTLKHIFQEKYKALFLHPVSWDDARRFDYAYQDFTLPVNAATNTFIRRLVYPSVETSRNAANTPNVTSVIQRLWWDQ